MTGYYAYNTKPTINDQMNLNFAEKPVWTNNNCACLRKHKWSHPVLRLALSVHHIEGEFFLLVSKVLAPPSDFVLAPWPEMDAGGRRPLDKLIHHTDSGFGGKPHFGATILPTWPFNKNDSQFWQQSTLLTVFPVSDLFDICQIYKL